MATPRDHSPSATQIEESEERAEIVEAKMAKVRHCNDTVTAL